jgi:hypothetical protein
VQYARGSAKDLIEEHGEDHQAVEKRAETAVAATRLGGAAADHGGSNRQLAQPLISVGTGQRYCKGSVSIDPANVTHWRKNKTGFPAPVVGGRSPSSTRLRFWTGCASAGHRPRPTRGRLVLAADHPVATPGVER